MGIIIITIISIISIIVIITIKLGVIEFTLLSFAFPSFACRSGTNTHVGEIVPDRLPGHRDGCGVLLQFSMQNPCAQPSLADLVILILVYVFR
jgi:hypothetical protein